MDNPEQAVALAPKAQGSRSSWIGIGLTTLASVLWGSTYPAIQIGLRYYDPYQISFFRALFATVALLFYFATSKGRRGQLLRFPKARNAATLLVAAATFGAAGFWTLLNLSIVFLEADTSSFLVALYPLIAIILATIFLRERLTPARAIGVMVGIAGSFVIVWFGEHAQVAGSMPLEGSLIAIGAALSWAFYMLVSRVLTGMRDGRTGSLITPEYVTLSTFVIALVPTTVIMVATGLPPDPLGGVVGLESVLYLGVVTSAFAFLIFNTGMKIIGVSRAAVNQLLFPAVTVVLSFYLLGETVNLPDVVGIGLIVLGVVVAQLLGSGYRQHPARGC